MEAAMTFADENIYRTGVTLIEGTDGCLYRLPTEEDFRQAAMQTARLGGPSRDGGSNYQPILEVESAGLPYRTISELGCELLVRRIEGADVVYDRVPPTGALRHNITHTRPLAEMVDASWVNTNAPRPKFLYFVRIGRTD